MVTIWPVVLTSRVRIKPAELGLELARRGWTFRDLRKATGLSPTVTAKIARGEAVTASTARRILEALHQQPNINGAELLLESPDGNVN